MKKFYLIILVVAFAGIVFGFLVATGILICDRQTANLNFYIALLTLVALLSYAWLTAKIAKASEVSARVTEVANAAFFPAMSLHANTVNTTGFISDVSNGTFLKRAEEGYLTFYVYLFNQRPIPGKVKFDIEFLYKPKGEKDLKESGIFILAEDIFKKGFQPDSDRYYRIQPNEWTAISPRVNEGLFLAWLKIAYPDYSSVIQGKGLLDIAQEIYIETASGKVIQPSRLYIRISMVALPLEITGSKIEYKFGKTFYFRFRSATYNHWDLIGYT